MAYAQNTIISANAANAYVAVLQGLLTEAGWEIVETLTPSGTFRAQVWKSDGAANQAGYDWYLLIKWNTVGTEQQVEVISGLEYSAVSKNLNMIPARRDPAPGTDPSPFADPINGDMWGAVFANSATNTATVTSSSHPGSASQIKPWFAVIVPSSAFGYWMSVTLDHVTMFTTISGSAFYHASTLDIDAAYAALPYVNPHVLVAYSQWGFGISGSVIGTGTTSADRRIPTHTPSEAYGVSLPRLDGAYIDAYAWKTAYYLTGLAGTGGTPLFDSPQFAAGLYIGSAIDNYTVYGGAIGDTVEVDGATYVLSGPLAMTAPAATTPCIAVLVEP